MGRKRLKCAWRRAVMLWRIAALTDVAVLSEFPEELRNSQQAEVVLCHCLDMIHRLFLNLVRELQLFRKEIA
jgi:hypothetical protein